MQIEPAPGAAPSPPQLSLADFVAKRKIVDDLTAKLTAKAAEVADAETAADNANRALALRRGEMADLQSQLQAAYQDEVSLVTASGVKIVGSPQE
jgi:hypothetical protein